VDDTPKSIAEAYASPDADDWKEAIQNEMDSIYYIIKTTNNQRSRLARNNQTKTMAKINFLRPAGVDLNFGMYNVLLHHVTSTQSV
jgi:hypothetical protein